MDKIIKAVLIFIVAVMAIEFIYEYTLISSYVMVVVCVIRGVIWLLKHNNTTD